MSINNITQVISEIPQAGYRGVDVQTVFVNKQEDFQDHLQGTTVAELNTLKTQLNNRIAEINSAVTTMNTDSTTASNAAATATTKAGEASTSANTATTKAGEANTFMTNASNSATKASQWADNNYNVAVESGKFSAKHWATEASNAVNNTNLLRADKYLAAQNVAGMVYNASNKVIKVQYINATDVNYEVMTYTNNKLSNVAHYVSSVLKGNTAISYSNGKLVSAVFTAI